jgi:hypothetical protein
MLVACGADPALVKLSSDEGDKASKDGGKSVVQGLFAEGQRLRKDVLAWRPTLGFLDSVQPVAALVNEYLAPPDVTVLQQFWKPRHQIN